LKMKTEGMPELQKHITPIMESAEKAADFVRKMMLYTKESPYRRERFSLDEFLDDFIFILKTPDKVHLHYERQHTPMPVLADRQSLAEALSQIVKNSLDAMPEGGDLFITSEVENIKARPFAVIKIRDTGQGIPPELIDRVYEPFFTTKDVGKGTGLGLCLAKGVIESLGGEITISSTPGRGTEVTVRLPLV
ncbi:MAG: sensor histidine kinase, partial [Nitrospirae bacterium]